MFVIFANFSVSFVFQVTMDQHKYVCCDTGYFITSTLKRNVYHLHTVIKFSNSFAMTVMTS